MPGSATQPSTQLHACPYLGLADDPTTWYAFPAPENHCHRAARPQAVALAWQTQYCLTRAHADCPVMRSGGQWPASPRTRPGWLVTAVIVALLLISLGLSVVVLRAL